MEKPSDFGVKKTILSRSLASHRIVQDFVSFIIRNKKFPWLPKDPPKEYLNCGCGSNIREEFINLDRVWQPGIDLCWDVSRKLPLSNSLLKGIYAEHLLEHFSFQKAVPLLAEFKRVLSKGGILRLVVPDAELYLDLYQSAKQGKEVSFPYIKKDLNLTPLMYVYEVFRKHEHQSAYDFETLRVLLQKAGFSHVTRCCFKQGQDVNLLIDIEWRKIESLYVEAVV